MVYLDTSKYLDAVCRMIEEGHTHVPVPIRGDSMRPFLRGGDFVFLSPLPEKIQPGDILLYQRPNGQYVVHRVYKKSPSGHYILVGDGQSIPEPVSPEAFRAKADRVRCGGQDCAPGSFRWWFFRCPWRIFAPWRPQIAKLLALFRKKK